MTRLIDANAPLIVSLTLPGRKPFVCIPHGNGGLHGARDFAGFQARISRAAEGDGRALIYLAWHAYGCLPTIVSLVGATAEPATEAQRERFRLQSALHRTSSDYLRSPDEDVEIDAALATVAR